MTAAVVRLNDTASSQGTSRLRGVNTYNPPGSSSSSQALERPTVAEHTRRRFGGVLGVTSLVAGLGFVCWTQWLVSSDLSIFERVVAGLMVGGLVAAPYLLIWLACRDLRYWLARVVIALALAGCLLLGIATLQEQDPLNRLFATIYQLAGTFVLLVLAAIIDRVWRWYSARSASSEEAG